MTLKSPWWKNSVRRRWSRFIFVLLIACVTLLAAADIAVSTRLGSAVHLPWVLLGLLALPLVYPLARAAGASRGIGLWAMALLGANVPWLLLLRHDGPSALAPAALTAAVLCYLLALEGRWWAGPAIGIALAITLLGNPPAAFGALLGMALHAAIHVRRREHWQPLLPAAGLFVAGTAVWVVMAKPAMMASVQPFWSKLGHELLLANAWLLPLLGLPLLVMALASDPAERDHRNMRAMLLALVTLGVLAVVLLCPREDCLRHLLALAPLAAVWLALGLARLQDHVPAWVWVPVGLLLVLTTLPNFLVNWSAQAVATRQSTRHVDRIMLLPLYAYLTNELNGAGLQLEPQEHRVTNMMMSDK